jgi:hypothetical protein
MAKTAVTLQALDSLSCSKAAHELHQRTLYLSHLPRPGDCIRDSDIGYVEVVRVVFGVDNSITLVIK